jgi:hypothetical protein
MKARKKILLAKIETTYGTDSAPTGAANAILTHGFKLSPLEGETVSRDLDRPTLGNDLQLHIGSHVMMEFDVEVAGAGAAGTAPAYGPLLRACGLAETIAAGVDVQYDPVSADEEAATMHFHHDGQKHAMLGARGSVTLKISPKGIPYFGFKFLGLWVDPASVADPAPDWSSFTTPLPVSATNTPTFSLHGAAYNLHELSVDQANDVKPQFIVGDESIMIVDRKPSGKVTIEAPALSGKNFFTTAKANTTGALQLVHGTAAGNIVQFDADTVQVLKPRYGDKDGVSTLEMDLSLVPSSAGDDEFKITVK